MANRIERLYAKIEGNPHVVCFSLLMHKPIEINNLLADDRVPPSVWEIVTNAFASINGSEGINGYTYDVSMTGGLVAIHKSRIGLEEMVAEMNNA
jgi:hypothetical protein